MTSPATVNSLSVVYFKTHSECFFRLLLQLIRWRRGSAFWKAGIEMERTWAWLESQLSLDSLGLLIKQYRGLIYIVTGQNSDALGWGVQTDAYRPSFCHVKVRGLCTFGLAGMYLYTCIGLHVSLTLFGIGAPHQLPSLLKRPSEIF